MGESSLPLEHISKLLSLLTISRMRQTTSKRVISNDLFAHLPLWLGNTALGCCPLMHSSHIDDMCDKELCQGSCHSPRFEVHAYVSHSNAQSSNAPSFLHDYTESIAHALCTFF